MCPLFGVVGLVLAEELSEVFRVSVDSGGGEVLFFSEESCLSDIFRCPESYCWCILVSNFFFACCMSTLGLGLKPRNGSLTFGIVLFVSKALSVVTFSLV